VTVIEMRLCVRCGASFRPLDFDQMCCSDLCSNALQAVKSLLPARVEPRARPMPARIDNGSRRGRGPIFVGIRFVVFEWQLEQLARLLGPLVDDFDLHEWFFTLDARVSSSHEIIPQRDGGQWLQARTMEEAQRRGLMVASDVPQVGKQTSRLAQALANIKRGFK
jgi:hypothetical protein